MRLKTILLAVASIFIMAITAQASEVSAYFSQGMTGSGFIQGAQQTSQTSFWNGPANFSGQMVAEIGTIRGTVQTESNQFIALNSANLVISNSNRANAESSFWGSANASAKNTSNTNTPGAFVFTENLNQATTYGSGYAQSNGNTVVVIGQ
jgi:hypothetical protein